jgi:hypothetical protein
MQERLAMVAQELGAAWNYCSRGYRQAVMRATESTKRQRRCFVEGKYDRDPKGELSIR